MTRMLFAVVLAASLAGCGTAPEANVAGNGSAEANAVGNMGAQGNIAALVLSYDEKQRNGVLARALIDAKLSCDAVMKSERVQDQNGLPAWRADCKNGLDHIISITPDGTAVILSAPDAPH